MSEQKPFYVGICMAGAISAGAYTAGVMDYLIEALEEWESRRGKPGVPTHRVIIPVLGGSSAGGMTGIVTAGAVNNPIPPVKALDPALGLMQQVAENKFYHSWVDLTHDDMFPLMLDPGDITWEVFSVLNSQFIDEISRRVIQVDTDCWIERPYFENNLKVFVTMTNLGGFSYDIAFHSEAAQANRYYLEKHNDYTCFILNKSGMDPEGDGWIPLSFRHGVNTGLARDAAMATGAFPLGLRARKVTRPGDAINLNPWISNIPGQPFASSGLVTTCNVDGGLINNEPFELVRKALNLITGEGKPLPGGNRMDYQDYTQFRSTVLMVDPFPSERKEYIPDETLMGVAGATLNAMMGQLRTKPEYLISAMDSKDSGQYLVAPKRSFPTLSSKDGSKQGPAAIACGSLGGFGGFLHKTFRIHDFFLGRANCERFLRYHFTVPAGSDNPIFTDGYAGITDLSGFTNPYDKSLQIIPLFTREQSAPYMPDFGSGRDWPVIRAIEIDRLKTLIRARADRIVRTLVKKPKAAVWLASKLYLDGKIARFAVEKIREGMEEHKLLE
jgi:hypothetical protein